MAARALTIAALLSVTAASARADTNVDAEARDLLQRGTALYQSGDYAAATFPTLMFQ